MAAKSSAKKAAPATKTSASTASKAPAKATGSKSSAPATKAPAKAAPAKAPATKASKQPAAKPAKAAAPAAKPATKAGASATKSTSSTAKQSSAPAASTKSSKAAGNGATTTPTTPTSTRHAPDTMHELPKPKFNKEGLGYTKDFDLAFIKAQYDLLQQERIHLTGQAKRLEDEAHQLVEEAEMGDVQFDDEGGEGDTMVVERERDLALSAQARDAVAEIDAALARIMAGTYGYSVVSGKPIPKERLEAIPWSSVLVEEKVGGIGRR